MSVQAKLIQSKTTKICRTTIKHSYYTKQMYICFTNRSTDRTYALQTFPF